MKYILPFLILLALQAPGQEEKKPFPLIPHHIKTQYAGGIGFLSAGAGYKFARQKLETDLFLGFVPAKFAGENLEIVTAKLTWIGSGRLDVSRKLFMYPFTLGMQVNYTNGDDLVLDLSTKYPKGYYGWTTAVHAGIFAGFKAGLSSNNGNSEKLLGYFEAGANEIGIISYAINRKAMRPWDIFNIALGLQFNLR